MKKVAKKEVKPLIAYAVINKVKRQIDVNDIFKAKKSSDIKCTESEEIIKVKIIELK